MRLRSNAERLYTVARPTWESVGQTVGDICLWKNKLNTSLVVAVRCGPLSSLIAEMGGQIYAGLVITSTLLPAIFLSALYPLVKRRFFPASLHTQYMDAVDARHRADEIAGLAQELVQPDDDEKSSEGYQAGEGLGIGLDLSKAREGLGFGGTTAQMGLGVEGLIGDEGSGKRKRKLRARFKELEQEYGAGTVVVLGDLAVSWISADCRILLITSLFRIYMRR